MRSARRDSATPAPPGFTIIEIVLVLAIISVLGALSYSGFNTLVWRSKRAERDLFMTNLALVTREYVSHHGRFPTASPFDTGWNPPLVAGGATGGQKYWNPTMPGWREIEVSPTGALRFHYSIHGEQTDGAFWFYVGALSDLDGDGVPSQKWQYWRLSSETWTADDPLEPDPNEY